MGPDHFVEFPQTILERAPLAIVSQHLFAASQCVRPICDQKEVAWQQVELPADGVRLVHHDQNQTLSVLPTFRLVFAKLDTLRRPVGRASVTYS